MDHITDGATHFSVTYGIENFFKVEIVGYGIESGDPIKSWFWWDGLQWKEDRTVSSRNFKHMREYVDKENENEKTSRTV